MTRKTRAQEARIKAATRIKTKSVPESKSGTTYDGGSSDDRKSTKSLDGGGAF